MTAELKKLELDADQRKALKRFRDDGLLWLVNTSLLHPRGFALTIHYDVDEAIGLSIQGDGSEPWAFGEGIGDTAETYNEAEIRREALWTPKLRAVEIIRPGGS